MGIIQELKENSVILFYGDSITDGNRGRSMDGNHILGHGYAYILSARIGLENYEKQFKFINKGISGNVISQLYERLQNDVIDHKPDVISILVGTNDVGHALMDRTGSPVERYIDTYRKMIHEIKEKLPDAKIVICEPFYLVIDNYEAPYQNTPYCICEEYVKPGNIPKDDEAINFRRTEMDKMQKALKQFVEAEGLVYVPLQEEFERYAAKIPGEYLVWDSIHPTAVGHELIASKWLSVV